MYYADEPVNVDKRELTVRSVPGANSADSGAPNRWRGLGHPDHEVRTHIQLFLAHLQRLEQEHIQLHLFFMLLRRQERVGIFRVPSFNEM